MSPVAPAGSSRDRAVARCKGASSFAPALPSVPSEQQMASDKSMPSSSKQKKPKRELPPYLRVVNELLDEARASWGCFSWVSRCRRSGLASIIPDTAYRQLCCWRW